MLNYNTPDYFVQPVLEEVPISTKLDFKDFRG